MVPTALVRPSLNTSLWSQCRYSGVLMKRKWTEALSPVRKQSLFMDKMVAVCLMLPQWTEEERQCSLCILQLAQWTNKINCITLHVYIISNNTLKYYFGNNNNTVSFQTPPAFLSLWLTHGLVSGGYRRGMMQHQDLCLKLPSGLWAQSWRHHHHAFPNGWPLDLVMWTGKVEKKDTNQFSRSP